MAVRKEITSIYMLDNQRRRTDWPCKLHDAAGDPSSCGGHLNECVELVVFHLDKPWIALLLATVERVVRAVQITRLLETPDIVLGVVNVRSRVVPAINARKRFRLPRQEIAPADVESCARLYMGIGIMLAPLPGLAAGALLGKFPGADPCSRLYG